MKDETQTDREYYQFARLDSYGPRERLLIRFIGYIAYLGIMFISHTLRFDPVSGWDKLKLGSWEAFLDKNEKNYPLIVSFWHDRIFFIAFVLRKARGHVMISKSFDGEYIARTIQRLGFGVIRGSSGKKGAVSALAKAIRLTKSGKRIGFTVDGPRGPRHKSKMGIIMLAKKAGLPAVPLVVEAKRRWMLKSWDKTHIPKPFSRAKIFWGEPVFVPADADEKILEEKRKELDRKLDELAAVAKEWRDTKN